MRRRRFRIKPVRISEELDVDIEEISRRGDGIARVQGFVIFVPNAKPGDRVRIKVTKVFDRFAVAKVVE
jgi:predicted RNA-binding protein with TRAM domain